MKIKANLQQNLKALLEQRDKLQKYVYFNPEGKKDLDRMERDLADINLVIKEVMFDLKY